MKGERTYSAGFDAAIAGGAGGTIGKSADTGSAPSYVPQKPDQPVRRTLLMQAMVDTFAQPGARAGAAWIAIVVFFATFAPFLASSFPIAMQTRAGQWRFPLFSHLYAIDVVLVVVFITVLVLVLWRRLTFSGSLLALIDVIVFSTSLSVWLSYLTKNIVIEEYGLINASGDATITF